VRRLTGGTYAGTGLLDSGFGCDSCNLEPSEVLPSSSHRQALRSLRRRWGSSARLVTRTKESNKYASHILIESIRRTEREARTSAFGVNRASLDNRCSTGRGLSIGWVFEPEHTCWDPKGGDLCLNRTKPRETWVEVRSDVDVQIAR